MPIVNGFSGGAELRVTALTAGPEPVSMMVLFRAHLGCWLILGSGYTGRTSEAIGMLNDAVQACSEEGFSDSTDAVAVAVWAGVHGYTTLQASLPVFPWPEGLLSSMVGSPPRRTGTQQRQLPERMTEDLNGQG
ncbi:TctA family transporter [Arthrobacter globiformis]|uniref:hypothetical protein n=1 Tax=Arthrobacter globiformis TaxID=1665 RepID=UPI00278387A6|nr:hypothetical protein [Arthrobacter globiformis]MDQ1058303.1 TctA family transporter [Arthrobacter globiformis]